MAVVADKWSLVGGGRQLKFKTTVDLKIFDLKIFSENKNIYQQFEKVQ